MTWVSTSEAPGAGLMAGAALFVYPSLYDGFALPVAQAMAAHVAVVTSDVSSMPEVGRPMPRCWWIRTIQQKLRLASLPACTGVGQATAPNSPAMAARALKNIVGRNALPSRWRFFRRVCRRDDYFASTVKSQTCGFIFAFGVNWINAYSPGSSGFTGQIPVEQLGLPAS